ncbi:MAG: hypothetical protein AAF098_10845 [Pseudomonadota bacterium]
MLEPSAGTGNLITVLLEAGYGENQVIAVERDYTLKTVHEALFTGLTVLSVCFLGPRTGIDGCGGFHRIVMNPPFRKVKQHMNRALSLLANGTPESPAVLVALVPITYQHPGAELLEELPSDTFATCTVNTKVFQFSVFSDRGTLSHA